jgi:protein gp37
MSDRTSIEWADASWNPVRGCTKISPGCKHCYAETFAERFRGVPGHPYEQGFDLKLIPGKLADPLRWPSPRMVFVNSMSDLFHKDIPEPYIRSVVDVMLRADWHTYQVLTKRADRLRSLLSGPMLDAARAEHIWWGVSVEDRKYGLPRVDHLRASPAAVRMLSVEPLLEDLGAIDLTGISWVIAGGESGPGARPMHPDWARSLRDRCEASGTAFFFKQWGGTRKARAGRQLDGRSHDDIPPRPARIAPDLSQRRAMIAEVEAGLAR